MIEITAPSKTPENYYTHDFKTLTNTDNTVVNMSQKCEKCGLVFFPFSNYDQLEKTCDEMIIKGVIE